MNENNNIVDIFTSPSTPETEDEKLDCCSNYRVSGCGTYFPGSDNCVPYRDHLRQICPPLLEHTLNSKIDANGFYLNTKVTGGRAPHWTYWQSDQQCVDWAKAQRDIQGKPLINGVTIADSGPPTQTAGTSNARVCLGHPGDIDYSPAPANLNSKALIFGGKKTNCQAICTTTSPSLPEPPPWCSDTIINACRNNPTQPFCLEFCSKRGVNCDNLLTTYCANLGIEQARQTPGCECFLPPQFYENWYKELSAQVSLPNLSTDPVCTYPQCSSASLKPYRAKEGTKGACPDIFQCIAATNINNDGTISGDVKINSDVKCSEIRQKDNPTPKPTPTPTPTPQPGPIPNPNRSTMDKVIDFFKKWWWALLLGLLFFILIVTIVTQTLKKSKKNKIVPQQSRVVIQQLPIPPQPFMTMTQTLPR
jgi:hypothetical protein